MQINLNPHALFTVMQNGADTLENKVAVPQMVKHTTKGFYSYAYIQRNEKHMSAQNLHMNIHSIIHNTPKLKTTQLSYQLTNE